MTRDDLLEKLPPVRTDWMKANVGDTLLVVPLVALVHPTDFQWAVARVVQKKRGELLTKATSNAADVYTIDLKDGYMEGYWNITELSREKKLSQELTTFLIESVRKL